MMPFDTLKYIEKRVRDSVVNRPKAADALITAGWGSQGRLMRSFPVISALFLLLCSLSANCFAATLNVPGTYSTITLAIAAASNGDTISVSAGTYSENIDYGSKVITIQGAGAGTTTIQGSGSNAPVVTFANSGLTASAVLDGFTINNSASNSLTWGVSITNSASPTLKNLVLKGNAVPLDVDGGAIYISGATATIQDSIIGDSTARNQADEGAGIYATGLTGTLTISGTTFLDNYVDYRGGAIRITGSPSYGLSMTGGSFDSNDADYGGAIYIDNSGSATFNGTDFTGNTATQGGNVVYADNNPINLINGTVSSNISGGPNSDGAFYLHSSSATFSANGTSFSGNNARSGGVIYATGNTGNITLTNTPFTNNSGTGYGGAININNTASTDFTTLAISGVSSIFDNNDTTADYGGAIYAQYANVSLTNGEIKYSDCNQYGAGIYMSGTSSHTLTVDGASLTYNGVTAGGSAIYVSTSGPVTINNATIENNDTAYRSSGAGLHLEATSGASTISNSNIRYNTVGASGAGIYYSTDQTASLTLTNTNVDSNTIDVPTMDGGGMYLAQESGGNVTVTINGGSVSNNSGRGGGAIYATGAIDLNIDGTTITGNTALEYGGGICMDSAGASLTMSKSFVQGNNSKDGGGGVYIPGGAIATITNSVISGNRVHTKRYGGGIFNDGMLNLYSSVIAGNYAKQEGGGLYANGTETIRNSIIYGNIADKGTNDNVYLATTTETNSNTNGIDPLFVNLQQATSGGATTAGDYRLCYSTNNPAIGCGATASGGIDTGGVTNAPADDILGNIRPVDIAGLGDGITDYDMGAYEYNGSVDNIAPFGGYTAGDVIPAAQVTQSTNGDGIITIGFRAKDAETDNVTLNTFEYSVDGGLTWNAPTNGDASASLSANWNNGGSSYSSAIDWSGTVHSFTFDTDHNDVTGMAGVDQSDVRIRFTVNDGIVDSAAPATSESFRVDNVAPTDTITGASYDPSLDTLTITGTNFDTIAAISTDIKNYVDWTRFVWDINGDDAATANITFVVGDVMSLTVTDATTLTLVFTGTKGAAIASTSGYGANGGADTLDVIGGFSKDAAGNEATTDGLNDGTLIIPGPIITITKLSSVISDPINGGINPKRIPGAVIEYSITPSNTGDGSPDGEATIVTDIIGTNGVKFDVTTGVSFTDGATSSALALSTVTYSDDAGPYIYDYIPIPDGDGCDSNITSIKITTTGTFAFGGPPAPSFTLKYRVRVK
jgi:predicted outer membrane repeat protein